MSNAHNVRARNFGEMAPCMGVAIDALSKHGPAYVKAQLRREAGPRRCAHDECNARLSSYNDAPWCWLHTPKGSWDD